MADVTDIIEFYKNLLIIQYHDQPKAQATIQLLIDELWASGILLDVRNGYDLDTATGVQLDVIGKYIGVDRFYTNHDPIDYFALTFYNEVNPDAIAKWGFTDYADYETFQENGTINYQSVLSQTNVLSDADFRVILHLKIFQNNINHSHKEIDDSIFNIFGNAIRPGSTGGMHMFYFITATLSAIVQAALLKNLLPRPMGVGLTLITGVNKPFFGFAVYSQIEPLTASWGDGTETDWGDGSSITWPAGIPVLNPNVLGFTTYAGYDTNNGATLIYDQLN